MAWPMACRTRTSFKIGIAQVEADVLVVDAGRLGQRQPFLFELIRPCRAARSLTTRSDGRLSQLEAAHDVVRHDFRRCRGCAGGRRSSRETPAARAGRRRHRTTNSYGPVPTGCSRSSRPAPAGTILNDEIRQERAGRLLQHEVDGVAIDRARPRRDRETRRATASSKAGSSMLVNV